MVQNRTLNHVYLIPILLFAGLILDGIIMNLFSAQLLHEAYVMVPRLMVVLLVVLAVFFPKQPLFLYALLFGVIYDSYYIGIIGIYTAGLASCIYLLKRSNKFITPTPFLVFLICLLSISYVEIFVFVVYVFLGFAQLPFAAFLTTRLGPTVLLNFFFLVLTYFPLRKLSQWMYSY